MQPKASAHRTPRNEEASNHYRNKAAEIIQKHKMLLLGVFLLVCGQFLAIFRAVL
jgi:hypothetical protein